MELIIGQNCYFDVAEANQMISDNFLPSKVEYIEWNKLTNEQKNVIIYRNTQLFENIYMFYCGCKVYNSQPMEWPRNINQVTVECPDIVKLGILLNGIKTLIRDNSDGESEYNKLINMGVEEFKDSSGALIKFRSDAKEISNFETIAGYDDVYKDIVDKYFYKYILTI